MNISLPKASLYVLLAVLLVAGWFLPLKSMQNAVSTTPQGGTTSTAKLYTIAVLPATPGTNATSTSIAQNTTGNDLYITSLKVGCEGLGTSKTAYSGTGLAAFQTTFATSSTAAPATAGGMGQTIGGGALTISTSSPAGQYVVASSTAGNPNVTNANVWPNGSFLSVQFNATNTAACTVGVEAFSS